jgi:hypothetical protein
MSWIMVDIEADGPISGDYSMICFGAVVVEPGLERTFYGELRPISEKFVPEALAVSGFTREQTLAFSEPEPVVGSEGVGNELSVSNWPTRQVFREGWPAETALKRAGLL